MLFIDLETYSDIDLTAAGVYAYVNSPEFQILLIGWAFDDEPVTVTDLTCSRFPQQVLDALRDHKYTKSAYNAEFERVCLNKWLDENFENWRCSMAHASTLALPAGLAKVAEYLKLPETKMKEGKALINYFSKPCAPTAKNGGRTKNLPKHAPEKWELFKTYCGQDVDTERELYSRLENWPVPERENHIWSLNQEIADRGISVDRQLVSAALKCDSINKAAIEKRLKELTGLSNPNSLPQLKSWLKDRGVIAKSLDKEARAKLLEGDLPEEVKEVLLLRKEAAKTSIAKYEALERSLCDNGKVHGMLQYYGAFRTGRWCLTGDHEVLTPDGWKRLDEWQGGAIACWASATEFISFQKAEALLFDYSGEMYRLETQRCSQISTPDHKMPFKDKNGNWDAGEIRYVASKRFTMPFTGRRTVFNSSLEHNKLRILVMVQADGHYSQEGDLRFHFSKQRKIERCKHLLRKEGLPFIVMPRGETTVIAIKSRTLPLWLRSFKDKTFGYWLLDESADVILDELPNWDAYRSSVNSIQYSTTNKTNADIIQSLAVLSGRSATLIEKGARKENWNTSYLVNIWLTPGNGNCVRIENVSREEFSGKVYCAQTNTGYFLVRRNGKIWVTGNSGRIIQPHNLPQNKLADLDLAREILLSEDFGVLEMLFGSSSTVLSQLIRTTLIPKDGYKFLVADFSAIEARVIAWLSDEKWRQNVFASHGKIYEASAASMFKIPFENITKALRQKGKVAELALGFQGAAAALIKMGALDMGISEEELPDIVKRWRKASPNIVKLWKEAEEAAIKAVQDRTTVLLKHGVSFTYKSGMLFTNLPSGRSLSYPKPLLQPEPKFNKTGLTYEGPDQMTKKWGRLRTYGGKIVENIVQAIARDALAEAMLRVDARGFDIVLHVHDEIICEEPAEGKAYIQPVGGDVSAMQLLKHTMSTPLEWAPGLLLKADGYECDYYRKD